VGGVVVAGKLLRGNQGSCLPPQARRLLKKAVTAPPEGLGRPRSHFGSGFFDGKLAKVCINDGSLVTTGLTRHDRRNFELIIQGAARSP